METHTNISEFNPMEDESDNHCISSTDDELEVLEEKMSKLKERKNYYACEKLKDQMFNKDDKSQPAEELEYI